MDQHHILKAVANGVIAAPALTAWWWMPYIQSGGQLLLMLGGLAVIVLQIRLLSKQISKQDEE